MRLGSSEIYNTTVCTGETLYIRFATQWQIGDTVKNLIAVFEIIRLVFKNGGPATWLKKVRVESQEQDSLILALRQDQEDMKYSLSLKAEREEGWQNRFRYLQYCYELEKLTTRIAKMAEPLPSIKTTHKELSRMLAEIYDQQLPLRSYRRVVIDRLMEELNTLVQIAEREHVGYVCCPETEEQQYAYCHEHDEWYDTQHWSCCEYCWEARMNRSDQGD